MAKEVKATQSSHFQELREVYSIMEVETTQSSRFQALEELYSEMGAVTKSIPANGPGDVPHGLPYIAADAAQEAMDLHSLILADLVCEFAARDEEWSVTDRDLFAREIDQLRLGMRSMDDVLHRIHERLEKGTGQLKQQSDR